ncbi:hypothetical protein RUMLAC_01699 [[Ruminococcus] lactaris ATCC 29176]|jgi:hypothetical protein|uniref:Uncharacterized protein n=1 Tax=[Ruminococcus] lactaris ATCC 29176 TaxID=471875 RepID=B5CQF3_9FIRM|nr:hypothetical protein RUMLAC_01699 [[Ruminococcus] lactaris ATCC 29176]
MKCYKKQYEKISEMIYSKKSAGTNLEGSLCGFSAEGIHYGE